MDFTKENSWAVGKIPSGLFIVTAKEGDQRDGYLASWIQQISFSPLLVTLAIKPGRPCYDLITAKKPFSIHVIGQNNNGVMKPFWGAYQPGADPFANLNIEEGENYLHLLDAMGVIECEMIGSTKPGDHELIVAKVVNTFSFNLEDKPLVHIRKSGLDY